MSRFKCTGASGLHITFDNGWTASVQFGPGTYSDNRSSPLVWKRDEEHLESSTAEVAAWPPGPPRERLYQFPGWYDTVSGYKSADEVLAFLAMVASLRAGERP